MTPTRIQIIFFSTLICVNVFCQRLSIAVPTTVHQPLIAESLKGELQVRVFDIHGQRLTSDHLATTYTVHRIFRYGVSNRSGSWEDLLQKTTKQLLIGQVNTSNYKIGIGDFSALVRTPILEVQFNRYRLEWYPPREFIMTALPRYPGTLLMNYAIVSRLRIPIHNKMPQTREDTQKVWEFSMADNKTIAVYPGKEIEAMNLLLQNFLEKWSNHLYHNLSSDDSMQLIVNESNDTI